MARRYALSVKAVSSGVVSAAATFCSTLFDEWVAGGVRHVVVAPGSRSTPLALAAAADDRLTVHVVLDERVAGFVALGVGLDGSPAVLVCTSGTAAANFMPAVVEAGLSGIPMLVCTADRPPELRGVGAPQTIDQLELYGTSVRWFIDADVPEDSDPSCWRQLARTALGNARSGPVHLNLPFREPLVGEADPLPEVDPPDVSGALTVPPVEVPVSLQMARGVVVAGGASGVDGRRITDLARALGWPLVADPLSGLRSDPRAVVFADALLRHEGFAQDHRPEVAIRIGRPPASKVLNQWIVTSGCPVIQVGGPGRIDPDHNVKLTCGIDDLERAMNAGWRGALGSRWSESWERSWFEADRIAERVIVDALRNGPLTEPGVAHAVAEFLPSGASLVVSSSMPVRDLEWFGGRRATAHSNRGANGIDGVVSTARGRALVGGPTVVLIGDLAFCHDANALWGAVAAGLDLRIVVVDNDGGGIFSFLPQASALEQSRFEQLFGTPHGADVLALAQGFGVPGVTVRDRDELRAALGERGPRVIRVESQRARNVDVHRILNEMVVEAIG